MRKLCLMLIAVWMLMGVHFSLAAISFSTTPSSQSVQAGGSFNVGLLLTVTQSSAPANVAVFDLYLVTAAANSGFFTITAAVPSGPFNAAGPDDSGGDALATAAATGFVRNGLNQGFSGPAQTTPITNLALEQFTLSVAANTPASTYTFQTSTTPTAGGFYSDVGDSSFNTYEATSPGTFSITVVPEPSTWALILAGVGLCGLSRLAHTANRRRLSGRG